MRVYSVLPQIRYSIIRSISEKVAAINKSLPSEQQVIDLTMGQNMIGDPTCIFRKIAFLRDTKVPPFTYAPSLGTISARESASNFYDLWFKVKLETDWIMITDGGMGALRNALCSVVNDGDIVVIDPFTFTYPLDTLRVFGRKFRVEVLNSSEDLHFVPSADTVIESLGSLSQRNSDKMIIYYTQLGFNPQGAFRPRNELKKIVEFVDDSKNVVLVNDIVYHLIRFDKFEMPLTSIMSSEGRNIFDCDALSKPFSLMGCRVGAMITRDKELFEAAAKIQQYSIVSPNVIACEIWNVVGNPENFVEIERAVKELNQKLRENFEITRKTLEKLGLHSISPGQGTLYVFIRTLEDSEKFVYNLIERAKVALVPGTAFELTPKNGHKYARITISVPRDLLQKALERIECYITQAT
ncbi:MAG: pyridoxal phosphate-dependent aminotransferase [Candidatus Korarchaeota archaeon]|nr:pyridoxal phosphate-dependent aminotransferase [Thermoproteota archaeon]